MIQQNNNTGGCRKHTAGQPGTGRRLILSRTTLSVLACIGRAVPVKSKTVLLVGLRLQVLA